MKKTYLIVLKTILFFICHVSGAFNSYAKFGFSCTNFDQKYISQSKVDELTSNSIFGFVQSIIDIDNCGSEYSGGCEQTDSSNLNICVKNGYFVADSATSLNSTQTTLNVYQPVRLGLLTSHPVVASDANLANIQIMAGVLGDKLCVVMPTAYGYAPLTCRNISVQQNISNVFSDMSECSNISSGCSLYSQDHSKTSNSFFGNAVQCVYESLGIIFFDPRTCDQTDINTIVDNVNHESKVRPFAEFYGTLTSIVVALITLYVIFFGIRMMLSPREITVGEIFMAIIKILLVVYFSIGFNVTNWFSGKQKYNNGVTQIALPMMVDFSSSLSSTVFNNANPSNLCNFSGNDYDQGYSYYALWDSMDCRMNVYMGINNVFFANFDNYTRIYVDGEPPSSRINATLNSSNAKKVKGIAFFWVIFHLLQGGGILPCAILLGVMLMVIGMMFSMLMGALVSIMLMYILGYIAPIFVPMSLFKRTKGYYDQWLNLCIATAFQPVVVMGFGAFILVLIDSFMFDQCVFAKYINNSTLQYVFELRLPQDLTALESCKDSLGYKLFGYYQLGLGITEVSLMFFDIIYINDVQGLYYTCWTALIMCFLIKYILGKTYELAASLSGGIGLGGFVSSAMIAVNAAVSLARQAKDAYFSRGKSVSEENKSNEKEDATKDSVSS